jgi:hypothetical protein
MGPAASVSAGRRSIAPALASSIACAGEIGESDPLRLRHPPATAHRPAVLLNVVTLACNPYHSSAFARIPPPVTGHSPNRAFFAWRSATHHELAQPGRTTQVFPISFVVVRRRSWGSIDPSQVYSRQPGGHATLRAWRATNTPLCSPLRHLCLSGPTCRSCLRFRPDLFSSG